MDLYLIANTLLPFGSLWNLCQGLLGLGFVIFVHELGHFIVAKACGVKCEKFYVGFDPPMPYGIPSTLFKYKWGETEYGLGIIPLGGYVKMLGQDDNPQNAAAEAERIRIAKENPDGNGDYEIDPRSYPAKTVPQRMAIISAGVVMNLIFAVLMAAIAYKMGVKFDPAMVGSTVPGDTAWKTGIRPGDRMLQFGKEGRRDPFYRFRDMRFQVIKTNVDEPMDVLVQHVDGSEEWKTLFPKERKKVNEGLATIGVTNARSPRVYDAKDIERCVVQTTDLKGGDLIKQVVVNGKTHEIDQAYHLKKLLYRYPEEVMQLVVDRPKDPDDKESPVTELTLALPPMHSLDFGLRMKMGAIFAIQADSPAVRAGFQKGDILVSVSGVPIEDPMVVDEMLLPMTGQATNVTVMRDDVAVELSVTPREREMLGEAARRGGAISAEMLGVAFYVEDQVVSVVPDSPAAKAGMQAGDRILSTEFSVESSATEEQRKKIKGLELPKLDFQTFPNSWPSIHQLVQTVPAKAALRITYQRDGDLASVDMLPVESSTHFDAQRGLYLDALSKVRTASSISEAVSLGFRETKEGIEQVFMTLKKINKLKSHLGGPLYIGAAAMSEASQGWPRLLIFLTLLSANLAVLNFLPIPVLDGGHIMFLIYEGVFGKPMPERIAMTATMVGLCFILGLMAYVMGLDVFRFAGLAGG